MRVRRAGQGLAALLVAGLAFPALLRAEPLYVIEQLAVNVNSAPDASGERVATRSPLASGALLTPTTSCSIT